MSELVAYLLAVAALVGSPGPATMSLAAVGAVFGFRRGLLYLAGLISGLVVVMVVAASGVTGVILAVPGVAPVLGLAAAVYILFLAFRIATAPPIGRQESDDPAARARAPSYPGGFVLTLVNPKAYASMVALFSGFVLVPDAPWPDALVKGALVLPVVTAGDLCWLAVGSWLQRLSPPPRVGRALNIAFAVLLVISVAFALSGGG